MNMCRCGCGRLTTSTWARGHSQRRYSPLDPPYTVTVDGCWEWSWARTGKGYGRCDPRDFGAPADIGYRKGRSVWAIASRVFYHLHVAPIPEGMQVLHRCDNPPCVNPDHLFLGTVTDNMRDKAAKGRAGKLSVCRQGLHPMSGDNVYVTTSSTDGSQRRTCRACAQASRAKRRERVTAGAS